MEWVHYLWGLSGGVQSTFDAIALQTVTLLAIFENENYILKSAQNTALLHAEIVETTFATKICTHDETVFWV